MKQISSILGRSAIVAGLGLGAFALAAVADWSNPPASPPSCPSNIDGCSAPLNVGGNAQVKVGGITVGGIGITSSNFVYKPSGAAVTPNSVLTALDATGTIGWAAPGGSSGGSVPNKIVVLDRGGGHDSSGVNYTATAGSYTISSLPVGRIRVRVWGGGGGGGFEGGGVNGASGGAGGYAEGLFTVATVGTSYTFTVGAGGIGGQSGAGNRCGGDGGTSSFGSYITAAGGQGGGSTGVSCNSDSGSTKNVGGAGGYSFSGSNLVYSINGGDGGNGGSSKQAPGGNAAQGGQGSNAGKYSGPDTPGGGGGGGVDDNSNPLWSQGWNGAPGRIIIEY